MLLHPADRSEQDAGFCKLIFPILLSLFYFCCGLADVDRGAISRAAGRRLRRLVYALPCA